MMKFEMSPEGPKMIPVVGELSEEQKEIICRIKSRISGICECSRTQR